MKIKETDFDMVQNDIVSVIVSESDISMIIISLISDIWDNVDLQYN